ncbi:hypothetical protein QDY63_11130 [Pseudomonas brenneri]|uniref:hypothetical protein n=1 Tax=Pseudomonas brenneri TaxID=129817 RepID=UPI0025A2AA25|nr:hypothetical protein [Pseudomonas brenneri]WJM93397.1 hypothetical protein QDY63_11130 [Pseudomonas brenneri]
MSTEKMRKDFERWECEADQGPQTDPAWLMYDANTKTYPLDKIQSRWEVWQASRAAIEVELPDYTNQFYGGDHFDECQYAADCEKAIESLGLKVKP